MANPMPDPNIVRHQISIINGFISLFKRLGLSLRPTQRQSIAIQTCRKSIEMISTQYYSLLKVNTINDGMASGWIEDGTLPWLVIYMIN